MERCPQRAGPLPRPLWQRGPHPDRGRRTVRPRRPPSSPPGAHLAAARHGSWSTPRPHSALGGTGRRASVAGAAAVARQVPVGPRRRPGPRQRRRGAADDPGRRGGRGQRRRGAARPRGATAQGSVPRRAVRETRQGGPRRPPEHRLRPDAGPPRAARGGRRRAMGDGARLRRPLRARDPDGRARGARSGLRGAPP